MTLKIPFSDSARNYAVARQIAFQLPNTATMSNPTKDPLTDTCAQLVPTAIFVLK